MERSILRLLVILLSFYYLICSNAATLRGSRRLLQEPQYHLVSAQAITEEVLKEEFIHGRMDFENMDYPGSGANNHHTPKPPGKS